MKPTIRNKLIAGFSCLMILMSAVAGIGTLALFSLKRDAHDATTIGDRLNSIAIEIQVHNLEAQRRVRSYLSEAGKLGPQKARETYLDEADFEINEMETLSAKAVAISPTADQRGKFTKLVDSLVVYKAALGRTIKAAEAEDDTQRETAAAQYDLAADALHDNAEDGEVVGRNASQSSEENIERTSSRAASLTVGISLLGLVLGSGVSILLLRAILRPVDHLKEVAESVSLGNLDIAVRRYSNDEIGDLADSFSRMVTAVKFFRAESEDALAAGVTEERL
jgi:methyl-accepting chemotaxis protein